jgi:single-strand DNA-binding protein
MSAVVTLTGRLVSDPDLKFTAKGDPICGLVVVTSGRRYNKEENKWYDVDTTYWTVAAWRQLGENVAESLSKGDQVVVVGKLKSRNWEDKDGNKRVAWEVDAQHVAADLSRATAKIQRVSRAAASAPADDPWSNTGMIPVQSEQAPF